MPVTLNSVLQVLVYVILLILITKPIGLYMTKIFAGERTLLSPAFVPVERLFYTLSGIKEDEEQTWIGYTISMLVFSLVGMLLLYLIERTQQWLPLNPAGMGAVEPQLAFNTAASFTSNTNWQAYTGETTMSYLTQMAGLAFHNFVSAATGIVLAVAFVRGLARRSAQHLGNFWVDLTRCVLYLLLPISVIGALVLVSQGVIQNFNAYTVVHTLDGATQVIAQGPVASQEFIKEFGTNGGGFFNTNSAHPYENPNVITNMIEMLAIFSIGAGLTYMFGKMVKDTKQGWAVFSAMLILFLIGVAVALPAEQAGNPALTKLGVDQSVTAYQSGGNMEGKDVRFGITASTLFAVITTDASCGAVNGFHDSYTPIGGMVPLANIALGEIIFGGVGSGLYGMLIFAILAVFIAGLMVGRTPEYLGKKIEQKEMKMAALAILILPASILGFAAVASVLSVGTSSILNPGPHGLSEILYAYTSATGNNGSAFAGLAVNTPFYNWTLGLAMIIGRFAFVVPVMALAGSLVQKKVVPAGAGTFPTTGPLFVALLIGVILIVGALTYFPAYALGPIVEHLMMLSGKAL
ncbi:potassium-transporting ATPase subunit KdpA [Ktedonospora formicarum]|uniref:Potassium-transporting ATPase potassium-binding subunit n=1 Tax=Ktedonospora formicarum TaxID=2778364 RepID=A0A8J3MU17_9CHLR|nr:potassium-transporting ATPase subunit KdpA [Ktedonospora formicarum]GHO48792.1 potassium-transporting ATPase potassium-binding subunit [Ktedonospora formicarum]